MKLKFVISSLIFVLLLVAGSFFGAKTVQADSLVSAKDTISTSRPSAAAPLAVNVAASDSLFWFDNNGSKFLASDSAKFYPDTGETLNTVIVASQSAAVGGSVPVYLATNPANTHHKGSVVMVPVTATHTISFTTVSNIPSNGKIKVVFPSGDTTNSASPSASGFSFNNIGTNNYSITGATCGTWTTTPASGLVQCNLNVGISVPTAITITVGAGTSGPLLINPTKTAAAGTADTWAVRIQTTDSLDSEIDYARVKIGTIESILVYATVDPTFTFTIAGVNTGSSVNFGNNVGCTDTETLTSGFNSTATEVNLGLLGSSGINIGAQLLTITTNGNGGYALTATSSGHLIDPSVGYWVADAQGTPTNNNVPIPASMVAGTPAFGIHPCGLDVLTSGPDWGAGADQTCTTGGGTNCYYANPSPTYYYSLANDSTGPVGNSITAGNGLVSVAYAATISSIVPAGIYRTAMTYVATPTF